MTSAFSWQNSITLPCFIPYSKAKFVCYSRCFLTSYFCIPVPYNEKDIFLGVLVLKGLVGLHRTVQLQLLQHYWLGHSLLMKVKKESEKASLKFSIKKAKIMASSPITSWQIDGETVRDFTVLGSKITADVTTAMKLKDAYSLEEKL